MEGKLVMVVLIPLVGGGLEGGKGVRNTEEDVLKSHECACVRAEKAGEAAGAVAAADSWIFIFPRRRHVHTTGGTSRAEGDDGNRRRTDCCLVEDERVARRERKSERAGASNQGKLLSRKRGQRERATASAEFP